MKTPVRSLFASRIHRLLGLTAGLGLLGTMTAQAQTLYAFTQAGGGSGLLVTTTLGSGSPVTTQSITGAAAGQTLVGLDSRPATGELFALGYNGAGTAQLYTLNKTTGMATAVGGTLPLALGAATERIGFDFNPTVDRIRVTSSNEADYRLNPVNGTVAATDLPLVFDPAAHPSLRLSTRRPAQPASCTRHWQAEGEGKRPLPRQPSPVLENTHQVT